MSESPLEDSLGAPPPSDRQIEGDATVTTGDIVIDAALRDLSEVEPGDLDGHIEAAETLQRTLQGRLANLGE